MAPICFKNLFYNLMAHESDIEVTLRMQHSLSCFEIIIRHLYPIGYFLIHKVYL